MCGMDHRSVAAVCHNVSDHQVAISDPPFAIRAPIATLVHPFGMPGMPINLWGVSPLYENESLKVGSLPTVTPIDQVLDEGNCDWATSGGKEACEDVRKRRVCISPPLRHLQHFAS